MKNLNYIILTFLCGVTLISCNDELDEAFREAGEATPILNDVVYELTSSDFRGFDDEDGDDYEVFNAFPSLKDAEIRITPILSDRISLAVNGLNAFVDVNYDLISNVDDEDLERYISASKYELADSDYPTAASGAFLPNEEENASLVSAISNQNISPSQGDVVRAEYARFTEEPVNGATIFNQTNFGAFEGWTPVDVSGPQSWSEGVQFNNVQMSGFSGMPVANEDWLISPEIDLSDKTNVKILIEQTYQFGSDLSNLSVLIANDYAGTGTAATWQEITFSVLPTGNNSDYVESEKVDISDFDGETVHIALRYISTDAESYRWRVRKIALEAGGLEGSTSQEFAFYSYNGTEWEALDEDNVYVLKDEDYDEMGAPGRFNNFSNSVLPENYLTTFVTRDYPFAQEEDDLLVIYDFFFGGSTGTLTRGTQYVFGTSWTAPQATLKFTFKNGRWEPNNATPYEFVTEDYALVVTGLANIADLADELSNLDRFGNFNRREGGSTFWDLDELLLAFNLILKERFPDTEVGQIYEVTIASFPTGSETYQLVLGESGDYIYVTE